MDIDKEEHVVWWKYQMTRTDIKWHTLYGHLTVNVKDANRCTQVLQECLIIATTIMVAFSYRHKCLYMLDITSTGYICFPIPEEG